MRTKAAALLVGLVLGVAVAGCGRTIQPPSNPNALPASQGTPSIVFGTPPPTPPGAGIHLGAIGDPVNGYNTPADLCNSSLVVEAIASAYGPPHWNSADGTRPASYSASDLVARDYVIYTPMRFSYWRVLHDARTVPSREYVLEGGQVGADTFFSNVSPRRPPIARLDILVFGEGVRATATPQLQATLAPEVVVLWGALPIDTQNMVHFIASPNHTTMPLSEVEDQLAGCPTTR